MPYGMIETNNKIIGDIALNLADITKNQDNYKIIKKAIENIIKSLDLLLQGEIDNPFFQDIAYKITSLIQTLKNLIRYFTREENIFNKNLIKGIAASLLEIINKIKDWIEVVKIKSKIPDGNQHLINLKIHQMKTRFYVKVRELNPDSTLIIKHPINEKQAELQRIRSNEELLKIDPKDPISGGRENRKGDDYNYPGSLVVVTQGHHRLYEIYRRYLQGRIDGEQLVELIIDKKFI